MIWSVWQLLVDRADLSNGADLIFCQMASRPVAANCEKMSHPTIAYGIGENDTLGFVPILH